MRKWRLGVFFLSYFILNSTIHIYIHTRNSGAAGSYERGVRSGACCCSSSSPCCLLARAAHAQLHALVDMSSLVPFLLLLLCMTCCVGALCGGGWVEVSGPAGGGATGGGVHLRRMWSSLCLHFRLARDGAQEGCFLFWGGEGDTGFTSKHECTRHLVRGSHPRELKINK